jgi:LPS O-antigen subunit length determinant protein (WzzB/FepE family)
LNPAANLERLVPMYEFFGKLLFPRLPPDVQRRKIIIILAVLLVGLLLGGLIALMMVLSNKISVR